MKIAVIGNGETIHPQLGNAVYQIRYPVGAVEEGVLGMRMEVDEGRHLNKVPAIRIVVKIVKATYVALGSMVTLVPRGRPYVMQARYA